MFTFVRESFNEIDSITLFILIFNLLHLLLAIYEASSVVILSKELVERSS